MSRPSADPSITTPANPGETPAGGVDRASTSPQYCAPGETNVVGASSGSAGISPGATFAKIRSRRISHKTIHVTMGTETAAPAIEAATYSYVVMTTRSSPPRGRCLPQRASFAATSKSTVSRTESLVLELIVRPMSRGAAPTRIRAVSYTHLRAHETVLDLVCRLLLE